MREHWPPRGHSIAAAFHPPQIHLTQNANNDCCYRIPPHRLEKGSRQSHLKDLQQQRPSIHSRRLVRSSKRTDRHMLHCRCNRDGCMIQRRPQSKVSTRPTPGPRMRQPTSGRRDRSAPSMLRRWGTLLCGVASWSIRSASSSTPVLSRPAVPPKCVLELARGRQTRYPFGQDGVHSTTPAGAYPRGDRLVSETNSPTHHTIPSDAALVPAPSDASSAVCRFLVCPLLIPGLHDGQLSNDKWMVGIADKSARKSECQSLILRPWHVRAGTSHTS